MDGLIYGGLAGFGFAAVENVFYLFGAYTEEGVGGVLVLAFMRAGLFGLNHAMYTAFSGLGVALSLEVKNKLLKPILIFIGFLLAVLAHAAHNSLATFTSVAGVLPFLFAIIVDWAGVFVILAIALWSFILERRRIVAYAEALVKAETIPQAEVAILKSTFNRRIARLKMLIQGNVKLWWKTGRYHHKVTEAAFAWHRLKQGDTQARAHLTRLQKEFLQLRGDLVPNNHVAVE
jgi:hypothetical protein